MCTDVSEEPAARLEYLPACVYLICKSDLYLYSCACFAVLIYFLATVCIYL